ncbi:MAG: hypothetical protein ACI4JB_06430 [Porcipelethomonas sp.]
MKKFYEEAEMEIVKFDVEDIITTSDADVEVPSDFESGEGNEDL